MFKKTRARLVLLNSVVFFLLINGFGTSLYFYMQYRLYKQAETTISSIGNHLAHERLKDFNHLGSEDREMERRITYLVWNDQKQLQMQVPAYSIAEEDIPQFTHLLALDGIQKVSLSNNPYLVLNIALVGKGGEGETCQLIYSMRSEQEVLHHLLLVIGLGAVVSILIAVLTGYFLAAKALVPIQSAWEKQQQFVSDASHELRTPLSVMKIQLDRLFRHPNHTIEEESEHISAVIQETKRMSKLVSNLLTLARSDSNQQQLNMCPVNLTEILKRTIELFEEIAMLKGITILSEISQPIVTKGDAERLQQLFVILLDNAVKYTQKPGTIKVICEKLSSYIRIEIVDTGIGIAKEDLPFLFDRFFRGDKARTRSEEGAGLGLSIAKWITDEHYGKIQVKSNLSEGTHVMVYLPIEK